MIRLFLSPLALLAGLAAPAQAEHAVSVFAAASLGGVLEEIAQNSPHKVTFSYGGSGTMARQIAAGAPADVVILASKDWMDWLAAQGVAGADHGFAIAQNTLVVVAPKGATGPINAADLPGLLQGGRLALGHHLAVPAGIYTHQWLNAAGLWPHLRDHLAETDNVRAALALVARGDAPFGVVYATDAQADPQVEVVYDVPPPLHDPIFYLAAPLSEAGKEFASSLSFPDAASTFLAHGYLALPNGTNGADQIKLEDVIIDD